jgi:hypothetical protein
MNASYNYWEYISLTFPHETANQRCKIREFQALCSPLGNSKTHFVKGSQIRLEVRISVAERTL